MHGRGGGDERVLDDAGDEVRFWDALRPGADVEAATTPPHAATARARAYAAADADADERVRTRAPSGTSAADVSARTSVGDASSTTDEQSPSSPVAHLALGSASLLARDAPRSDDATDARARARARARRQRRIRNGALCAVGCCALTVLATMLTICVAFTGRALGPLAPLVVDMLTHMTGLTVGDAELSAFLLQPPRALPTAMAPAQLLPQTGQPGATGARGTAPRPNVLIFLADDLGYSDVRAFGQHVVGHSNNSTPNLDRLAADGLMLTQFLTETICTPARAALLTGRYPARYGMSQDVLPQRVIFTPGAPTGLPKRELTIASALKAAGYRTALTGKWHLGISAAPDDGGSNGTNIFLPVHHGFDDSLVFPFSNFQKCDPYVGRQPPEPADQLGAPHAAPRAAARAARRAAHPADELELHTGGAARDGGGGARERRADGVRPATVRRRLGAAAAAPHALTTNVGDAYGFELAGGGGGGPLLAGWETVDGDDEIERLERLVRKELEREEHDERDDRKGSRHERREERHLSRAGGNNSQLVRSAADVFAQAAGLRSGTSEYGYASNGLFCFLMANNTIVQQPADMLSLEDALVRHATTFIRKAVSAGTPWLLYFADLHPHTALFNHPRFGPGPPGPFESGNGQYGQVLREMDWAVGELLNALDELQIERDTLVIFTSDNGPYQEEGWSQSGRKGGLKGGKGQTWEGGIRVPAIVRWPGVVPAGAVSSAPVRALDIMPTVAAFAGVRLPVGLQIDGVDQSAFFQRPTDALNGWLSTRRTSFHYCGTRPIAARYLEYKIHWATQRWDPGHEATCTECCPRAGYTAGLFGSTTLCQCDGKALDERSPPLIFNIRRDPNETRPIKPGSAEHTHVVHAAELARDAHLRTIENDVPCVNCPLPVPLKTWPCCAGSLPQCAAEGQCGLTATLSAACTYALVDHMRHGRGRCECNHCRPGDCGSDWT